MSYLVGFSVELGVRESHHYARRLSRVVESRVEAVWGGLSRVAAFTSLVKWGKDFLPSPVVLSQC